MRFTSAVLFLGLSVMAAAGLGIRQTRETSDISSEFGDDFDTAVNTIDREGRMLDLCQTFYDAIKDVVPREVQDVVTVIAMVPEFILIAIFSALLPGSQFAIIIFVRCWREVAITTFGSDPTAAIAELEGDIHGDVFFAQTLQKEGKPMSLAVVGAFNNLTPRKQYEVTVHKSGDIADDCAYIGSEYSALGGAKFTADDEGKAVLLIQNRDVLLEGTASVLGRSVVVTPVGGGKPTCAVIARNIVDSLH